MLVRIPDCVTVVAHYPVLELLGTLRIGMLVSSSIVEFMPPAYLPRGDAFHSSRAGYETSNGRKDICSFSRA